MKPTYLVCFDTETTSAEPKTARVVQFAAIGRVEGSDTYDVLMNEILNPEVMISQEAASVHGISQEQASQGRLDKYACQDFVDKLHQLKDDYEVVLATHNGYSFDRPIVERLANASIGRFLHIDTLIGAVRLYPEAPNHKLSVADPEDQKKFGGPGLIQTLGLGEGLGAHDALADICMVDSLVRFFSKGLGKSFVELAQWCEQPRVLEIVHFGKHRGKRWADVPYWYIKFICEKFDSPTPDLVATIWHWHKMRFHCLRA